MATTKPASVSARGAVAPGKRGPASHRTSGRVRHEWALLSGGRALLHRVSSGVGSVTTAASSSDPGLARLCLRMSFGALGVNIARNIQSRRARRRAVHVRVTDFDPFDPATAADPYRLYGAMLAGPQVHYSPKRDIYILCRYVDVRAAARDCAALSSAGGVTFSRLGLRSILTSDPPTHTRLRKQLMPAFSRGALESSRPVIDRLARELVADLVTGEPVDVVSTVAEPMPMRTITHVLGVGAADQAAFREWSRLTARVTDVNFTASGLRQLMPSFNGFRHLYAFFVDALTHEGRCGTETVLGRLATLAAAGADVEELFFSALLLVLGGYETTANLLSTLFLTLADYPDQLSLVRERPDLISSAIEEQLRFASPIQNFYRTATADYHVGSAVIPCGARVMLAWGAANRDPRQFDDPDVFRADRNPAGHIAFGSGAHMCLGAQLARMQGQAVLREIVNHAERIEVAEPPTWSTNANLRGLTRLHVRMTRRTTGPCGAPA